MSNKGKLSPSPDNYVVGKGFLIFKPVGEADFFHLGNVPSFVFTPSVEKLEHYSSMQGTKEKDKVIITQKTGVVKITCEEFTKRNLGIMLMGDVDDTDPDNIHIEIFSRTDITGELRFYATNDEGPRWRVFLNKVQFTPGGDFSPISENLANMVLNGDVYSVDGSWGDAYLVEGDDPVNITSPFITGDNHGTGNTLTVSNGGWIDADSFTYQWKKGGVNISGATDKDYTTVSGDSASTLTCVVTGVNNFGSASATSLDFDLTT